LNMQDEKMFRELVEFAPDAIIVTDGQGKIAIVNSQAEKTFGYTREELLGAFLETLVPASDIAHCPERQRGYVASPGWGPLGLRPDWKGLRRDGTEFPVEISPRPIAMSQGVLIAYFIRDVTGRRRIETELNESQERYRTLFDAVPVGLVVLNPEDYSFADFNYTAHAALGYTREEFKGLRLGDLNLPVDEAAFRERRRRVLEKSEVVAFEKRHTTRSGEVRDVDVVMRRIQIGGDSQILSVWHDCTDKKIAEQKLRDLDRVYRTSLESLPQLVWTCNSEGECNYLSRRWFEYTGQPADDFSSDTWIDPVHPEDREKVQTQWQEAREKESTLDLECRLRRADGTYRWFRDLAAPMRDSGGSITHWLGTSTDIHAAKLAETALRESESRLRQLADAMPQMAWTAEPDGTLDYFNERWCEYAGMSRQDLTSPGGYALVHPDDLPGFLARWRAALEAGEGCDIEYRLRRADGVYRWFLRRAEPVRNSDGQIVRWFGTSTDIEDYKLAEEKIKNLNDTLERRVQARTAELRESEARYRALVEGVEDYAILMLDPGGSIESWTACAERILGYTESEILGKHFSCFYTTEDRLANRPYEVLQAAIKEGHFEDVGWRLRKDGRQVWADISITALRDESGRLRGFSKLMRDITERKTTGERLRQSEEQFRALLESAPDAVVIFDAEGSIALGNVQAERLFGYERLELVGRFVGELIPATGAASLTGHEQWYEPIAARGSGTELSCLRKDGSEFPAEVSVRQIQTPQGARVVMAVRDITERRQAELSLIAERQKAEAASRIKSEFLATMSHEIRTPMNAILGMSDLLWDSDLNTDQRQYVEVFRRAGASLLALIDGILDLSKIEAGRFELERIEFDLEETIEEAMELVSAKAYSKGLAVLARVSPKVSKDRIGDPARLRQILINLLGNAVKFTELGQVVLTVELGASEDPEEIRFAVSDTGIGIPPDKLNTIFEDFVQADSSTTRKYGGTGLGLAICWRLAKLMGGQLVAESELGMGSKFHFTTKLPPAPPHVQISQEMKDFHGCRALIIDHNATNRLILRETLGSWGFDCVEYGSAEGGIKEFARCSTGQQPYSLVLVDHHVPRIDGFEVAAKLRSFGTNPSVIMLTSDIRPGDATRCLEAGFAGYAVKPAKRSELLRLVCKAMKVEERSEPSRPFQLPAPPKVANGGLRILVAEDSADNRLLLKAYFKGSPHQLVFVEDGRAAVEQFSSPKFDLVLMDVSMPVMDGLTATRAIRAIERESLLSHTPIVAITANARPEDIDQSRQSGCDAHLSKPISKQRLLAAVESYANTGTPSGAGESSPATTPDSGPILVEIPEGLDEIVGEYLALRKHEASLLEELRIAGEFDRIRVLAHNMKGTGASYGMPKLTELGAAMEIAAKATNEETLAAQITDLRTYLGRVELQGLVAQAG
jgi:PAS domain S-box-containing protein